ncbi:hypothetical protein HMPREF9336_04348 [Segniliparus rugosus ATCC BAA-974]|uniref:HTH-type transcriptional regulator MT1864/Rv1816-like C-terminal domain-containing protein n=2 Tax=Segniliparus rugosus TaxID=286804 RepID=U1N4T7_SEGRC|nr:hypothetical protein HMPREF9336_04348 [Segniliparus rugosus ATCC BAA-974]
MAPAAVYRYFSSQAELISALCVDGYAELGDAMAAAVESHAADPADVRFWAAFHAFRRWALANRNEFALLFGTPIPGFRAETEATGPAAGRVIAIVYTAFDEALREGSADTDGCFSPVDPVPGELGAYFLFGQGGAQGLRRAAIAVNGFCSVLGFLVGEVFGSASRLIGSVDELYAAHLRTVMVGMGFSRERVALLPDLA